MTSLKKRSLIVCVMVGVAAIVLAGGTAASATVVAAESDLSITIDGPESAYSKETVTYVTTVTNAGPDRSSQRIGSGPFDPDKVPSASIVTWPTNCRSSNQHHIWECVIPELEPGESYSYTVAFTVASPFVRALNAYASVGQLDDPDTTNNSAQLTTWPAGLPETPTIEKVVCEDDTLTFDLLEHVDGGDSPVVPGSVRFAYWDSDPWSTVYDASYGRFEAHPDGTVTFTPKKGETGRHTIAYQVSTEDGDSSVGELAISIAPTGSGPVMDPAIAGGGIGITALAYLLHRFGKKRDLAEFPH